MNVSQPKPVEIARNLMRSCGRATLATVDAEGAPFASFVITAQAADGSPLLLLSRLAVHSRNIARDHRISLLMLLMADEGNVDEALGPAATRLTLTGRALPDPDPESRRLFLTRHPDAAAYAGFADFSFYRLHVDGGHLVAGFGLIVDLTRDKLMTG